ncbi:MAG: sigma-70 family RNA polymerase sigma factor [Acidobacteriota bacterium]
MPNPETLEAQLARDLDGAFERLVSEYQDRLFGFALRLCRNREDAEEVAQDSLVRAYRALKTYPADRIRALSLRAWLFRIALNVARNRFRRRRQVTVPLETAGGRGEDGARPFDPVDDPEERPDRRLEKSRGRADLETLVHALPDRFRTALILRYIEEMPIAEVATVLGQPLGTAKSNVHRAINALRVSLSNSRSARVRALEAIR